MIGLLLEMDYCPDGVIVTEGFFRRRTDRIERLRLVTADLADPVVLQFVNARDDLVPFMSKYTDGSIHGVSHLLTFYEDLPSSPLGLQNQLREMLLSAGSDEPIDPLIQMTSEPLPIVLTRINLSPAFNLERGKPRMLLRCADLPMFMQMEIAMVALEGAKVVTCEHCRNLFLTGPSTSRRSDATFCSDRCRVAAMRARKKESR
jgi:hypothetical protein